MQKILLITYYFPPNIGGGEEYLYNIYRRLDPEKVVVLAHGKAGEFDKRQNFKIYRANFFAGRLKPTWRPMAKIAKQIIKKENIETLHFGNYAHYILLARILKMPYLTFIQGTDLASYAKSWFGRQLTKSNLKRAQKIITCSHFLKNKTVNLGVNKKKIQVLHPGLNLEEYNLNPEDEQALAHLKKNKIILSVGRLVKIKGFDFVIRALPEILKKIPEAIYIIVGDGEEKENLKKQAFELGIKDKVIFTGEIKDKKELSKYYKIADVYAGPSRAEGFGIVFLEARAFGLPIVASDVGGIKEAIGDRRALVKPEDTESLTQNIIKILQNPQKYFPDKNFDWDKKTEEIKNMLNNITV